VVQVKKSNLCATASEPCVGSIACIDGPGNRVQRGFITHMNCITCSGHCGITCCAREASSSGDLLVPL